MSVESDVITLLPVLRRYARALTGDAAWADDLVQDTAERALNRRFALRAHSSLRAWLFTVLRNLYIDQLRKQRNGAYEDNGAAWRAITVPVEEIDGLFLRDVQRALYRLPVDQREVLLLIGLEELSYRDAATVLKIPIGTVMSRLSRAREQLHSLMFTDDSSCREPPTLKVVRNTQ